MPQIDFLFLAEAVRSDSDGTFSALGCGFDTLHVPRIPARVEFHLVTRVSFSPSECGMAHPFQLSIQDTDANVILNIDGTTQAESRSGGTGWPTKQLLNLALGVVAPSFGHYTIELAVAGGSLRREQFRVMQAT